MIIRLALRLDLLAHFGSVQLTTTLLPGSPAFACRERVSPLTRPIRRGC